MSSFRLVALIGISLLMIASLSVFTSAQLTPPYEWRVMQTEHFRVIFHQEVEGLAREAAAAAEDAYQRWAQELNATPPPLTDIVVIDVDDSPNGFADIFELTSWEFTSQVQFDVFFGGRVPSNMGDTVHHEYWHIVDIDKVSGPSRTLRRIFGRVIMPGDVKPQFNVEGSATYAEYLVYGYSRASWALSAMILRQMALDNEFPPLDKAATSFTNMGWPSLGTMWYLLGSWLMRYIEEEHGRGIMAEIDEINAQNWLSTLSDLLGELIADRYGIALYVGPDFGEILAEATGVPTYELYEGFQLWLKAQAEDHLQRVRADGITPSVKVTSLGYWTGQPKWSPDGNWIAYDHSDPFRRGGIRLVRPDGTDEHALTPAVLIFEGSLDWSPDSQKIVYSGYDQYGPYLNLNDLYLCDLVTGETRRLTRGARAYNPVFTLDGKSVLFAQNPGGDESPRLARLDLGTGKIEIVREFPDDTFLDMFSLSPDGTKLALSIWKRPGFSDLYVMDLPAGELKALTQDPNEDFRPTWSPDGQYILFDSIRDETFNLYAVRVSDGKFFRVTNVVSGAFSPTVSPDGSRIAFVGYGKGGYDIHTMPYNPADWKPVEFPVESIPAWEGYPDAKYPVRPYDPLATMRPKYWVPLLREAQFGVSTSAWDALYRHYYAIEAGYDWEAQKPFASLFYINEEHLAPVRTFVSLGLDPWGDWESLSLEYSPVARFFLEHTLSLSLERSNFGGASYSISGSWEYFERFGIDRLWHDLTASLSGSLAYDVETSGWSREAVLDVRDSVHVPIIDERGPHRLAAKLTLGWSDVPENFRLGGDRGLFLVRGQPRGVAEGSQILAASLEYRYPIVSIERGWGLRPLFLDDFRGAAFVDAGSTAEDLLRSTVDDIKLGFGFELQISLTTGYTVRQTVRLGVAYGLGQTAPVYYLGIGSAAF
jgi:hypothetical protein